MARVWNFVLPESGEHTLRIEAIGGAGQRVFLDNVEMESREGQVSFAGPGGALLRLKQSDEVKTPSKTDKDVPWTLLVNERQVEEAALSGNGLRDLRSMTEGSYTIATGFDAGSVIQNACRKFKFLLDAEPHEVTVAHQECVWQVAVDGKLVDQEAHNLKESVGRAEFAVLAASGVKVPARLEMTWVLIGMKWSYSLQVGGVIVPACWNKGKGVCAGVVPPTIASATAGPLSDTAPPPVEVVADGGDKEEQAPAPESLPQGVSYDRETKAYQANIMDAKLKRYVFLGEFPSVDAAHQMYKEALEKYAPDKKLAPALVA